MKKKSSFNISDTLRKILFLLCVCSCSLSLLAQSGTKLKGRVVDEQGESLPGTLVKIEGSARGAIADNDGSFTMDDVPVGTKLTFSLLGMQEKTITFQGKELVVILETKTDELSEVTVVAFARQKKESVIASITTIRPEDLKVPSSNLTTALAGRIAGLISYQRSGEPGLDNAEFFIRGVTTFGTGKANPLILIDNVEMTTEDLSRLTVDDIASFSIMKDANATALYGARGANGVILVTTKEGREGKMKIQFRMEGSRSSPTDNVKLADPVTYMRLQNEAVRTRDPMISLPYSSEKINNTELGLDPIRYPAVNWQDMLFTDHTFNQRYNLNVSGGGTVARYYIAASYSKDTGIIKMDKRNNFNNNIDINRYVLRTNVNVNLTKTTEVIVRLHGAFDGYSGPLDGGTELYNKALNANPVYFLPYWPADKANTYTKHILFGNYGASPGYVNPYADMVKGYKSNDRTDMFAQFELKQNLDFITKGLSARGLFNVNRYSLLEMRRAYEPFYYALAENSSEYNLIPLNPNAGRDYLEQTAGNKELTSSMYVEGALQYNRKFAEKHNVSGLLVYTLRESLDGNIANDLQASLPHRNVGLAGRLTYGYEDRYFIETNFGYNGSERFAQSERFGFFPSAGVGWIVSNEKFMEPLSTLITKLKLKATYGLVGNDAIGNDSDRFFYLSKVNPNDAARGFLFGDRLEYSRSGVSISRYADPLITWEVSRKMNLGYELNLLNSLEIQMDYFTEKRSNILQARAYIPTTMGLQGSSPSSNIGKAEGKGIDLSVDYNKSFNKNTWMVLRGNFTYATSRYDVYEEPDYPLGPRRSHQGQNISQQWGLIAERLFLDDDEVKNSPQQLFGEYGAGDIKYRDVNGDMQIDNNDFVPIGFPTTPEIIYGFGISGGYKNFDISCFFQGSARSSFWIDPVATAPFIGNRALLQYWADDHWSEDNRNIYAQWPRLSSAVYSNNTQRSTWFMRDGSFIRLKTMELGYTLPKKWLTPVRLQNARVYVTGNNLLLFSKFKMWDIEMAGNGLAYPIQRVFNVGINVEF